MRRPGLVALTAIAVGLAVLPGSAEAAGANTRAATALATIAHADTNLASAQA